MVESVMDSAKYIPDESAATLMMISFPALVLQLHLLPSALLSGKQLS